MLNYSVAELRWYYFSPIFDKNAIALCRFPVFIFGILMAYYGWGLSFKKRHLFAFAIFVILIIWIIPTKELMYEHFRIWYAPLFVFYITMVIPLMVLMAKMVEKLDAVSNRTLLFIGGLSLEIYIIHIMILNILRDCRIIENDMVVDSIKGCLLYVVVISISILLAYCFSCVTKKVISNS